MPNALPLGSGTRVFSGARAIFKFNGETIGFATGVSGSEDIRQEPIKTLDHLETREHVPTSYDVTFTAAIFRTVARGQVSDNKDAPGSLKQQNIFPRFDQILRYEGVDAAIIDEVTGKILYEFQTAKCTSHSFNIPATGVVLENVTFVAIFIRDESEIQAAIVA